MSFILFSLLKVKEINNTYVQFLGSQRKEVSWSSRHYGWKKRGRRSGEFVHCTYAVKHDYKEVQEIGDLASI